MTALLSGLNMNKIKCAFLVAGSFLLFACSSGVREEYAMNYKGQIGDPIIAIAMLSEQQYEWAFIKGRIERQRALCLLPVRGCGGKIYFFRTKSKFAVDKGHPVC